MDSGVVYKCKINLTSLSCYLTNFDKEYYNISNFTGYQFCLKVKIPIFDQDKLLPVSLFNGKREGDKVTLHYHMRNRNPFTVIAICSQLDSSHQHLGPFEQALYKASYEIEWIPKTNRLLLSLMVYNSHMDYAKSLNFPIKLYLKTYEPILLIDYIKIGCHDINGLIKLIYYDLFIQYPPLLAIIND